MPSSRPIYAHPERVIAFAHVHYPPTHEGRRRIHAFGALEVVLQSGTDATFTRHHKVYGPEAGGDPFADIFGLLHPDAYWVSALPMKRRAQSMRQPGLHLLRHEMALHWPFQPRRQRHQVLRMRESALQALAADYSISIAAPDAPQIAQARLIPDRAQAVWTAWVDWGFGADPDRLPLLAAFRAWRKLDEQRVISF